MFWDNVADVYDVYVNVINKKTHQALRSIVADLIDTEDAVLECACGTGLLSAVIADRCKHLTATDVSEKMLRRAQKNCAACSNITFCPADITSLSYADCSFDKVAAGNVIHLLDNPLAALKELDRVCKPGGKLIIPTYMNREKKNQDSSFIAALDKAGAGFKQQFTASRYGQFFRDAGYSDVHVAMAEGRIPCAVAVMTKKA